MPAVAVERTVSREVANGDRPTAVLKYLVTGTGDEQAALTALATASPGAYNGLARTTWTAAPIGDGSDAWDGTVNYALVSSAPRPVGQSTYSFDTGGGTQHITQAKQHIHTYSLEATDPDLGGAIGYDGQDVQGCDITVPVYNFSETHYLAAETVTDAYKGALFALTGKVNSDTFRGCAAGEVLFLGASGTQRQGDNAWEITFRFAASPNATDLVVGPIAGIAKKGWEYLWVQYEDYADNTAKALIKRPHRVYVERVYDLAAFSGLGI